MKLDSAGPSASVTVSVPVLVSVPSSVTEPVSGPVTTGASGVAATLTVMVEVTGVEPSLTV
jgi:hypothetical protein